MSTDRVQKILAQAGIASRRKAEELIREGVVTINGKVAKLGDKAEFGKDAIKVRGRLIHSKEAPVYLVFHKPRGVLSTMSDPGDLPTMASYLDKVHSRVFPVGRLDFNSEGLLLLTNDGAFAEQVQKSNEITRVYHVKVKGHPEEATLTSVRRGVRLEGRLVRPQSVRVLHDLESKAIIEVIMVGAGNTDLKSLFSMKGLLVEKMTRVSIGNITLHGLAPGHYRLLKKTQAEAAFKTPTAVKEAEEAPLVPEFRAREAERQEERQRRAEIRNANRTVPLPKPIGGISRSAVRARPAQRLAGTARAPRAARPMRTGKRAPR